jgi:hypothetical protein
MSKETQVIDKLLGDNSPEEFFDAEYARHLEQRVQGSLPREKFEANRRQLKIAKQLHHEGSVVSNVTGQKLGSVDARIFHRWQKTDPNFWKDPIKVERFLLDNPQCRAPGWKPKYTHMEKGVTYVGGVPVTPHAGLSI